MFSVSNQKNKGLEYLSIMAGALLLAAGLEMFFDPNHMVVGGFSGLAVIIKAYSVRWFGREIPIAVTNLALNLPLFAITWKQMGRVTFGRTVFATLFFSLAVHLTGYLPKFTGDLALAAIYGGVLSGTGLGLVLRGYATTGGTDLVASILHRYLPHWSVSKLLFMIDTSIIALGFFVFGAESALYAIIAVFISSKCITVILEGMSFSKMAFIVSDQADEIAQKLMEQADRGVTALQGEGMYTRQPKNVLLCVFSQKDITLVKEIVRQTDPKAFVMLTDAREVLGEGFQSLTPKL